MVTTPGWHDWLPTDPFAPEADAAPAAPDAPSPAALTVNFDGGLPLRQVPEVADLWVVGAHGGAGETTLCALADHWTAAEHTWPQSPVPARVLVCARTSASALIAAQSVLRQWADGHAGTCQVVGLALLADAPGRLPKPLRDLAGLVAGGAPACWRLPWVEPWRLGDPATPREAQRMIQALSDDLGGRP